MSTRLVRMSDCYPFYIEGLGIQQIIINGISELVEIKGSLWDSAEDCFKPWDMICEMETLTDLLLAAGEEGEKIIGSLSLLSLNSDQEQLFDVSEILGYHIFFEECIFACSYTGGLDKSSFDFETPIKSLLIESFIGKEEFVTEFPEQYISKALHGYITMDILDELLVPGVTSNDSYKEFIWHLEKIGKMYENYLLCLEDECEEIYARTRAGFKDGQLFRIARLFFQLRS